MSFLGELRDRDTVVQKAAAYDNAISAQARQQADLAALQAGYNQGAYETASGLASYLAKNQYSGVTPYQAGVGERAYINATQPSANVTVPANATQGARMSQLDDPRGNYESPEAVAYRARIAANKVGNGLAIQGVK